VIWHTMGASLACASRAADAGRPPSWSRRRL